LEIHKKIRNKNGKKYKPIACGLYDELELRALRKQKVTLTFLNDNSETEIIKCVIADLFSKDKIEFLKTTDEKSFALMILWN